MCFLLPLFLSSLYPASNRIARYRSLSILLQLHHIKKIVAWMKLKFSCSFSNIILINTRISHSTLYKILNTKTKKYLIHKMLNGTFTLLCLLLYWENSIRSLNWCFYRINVAIKLKDYWNSGYIQIFNLTWRRTGIRGFEQHHRSINARKNIDQTVAFVTVMQMKCQLIT